MRKGTKIWDCFTFYNELEVLEIRLEYLKNIVDYCVIAQAFETHRGDSWKPMLNERHSLVKKYSNSINFIFCMPETKGFSIWERERLQRNSLNQGLKNVEDSDLIIVSDVDEIPNVNSIIIAREIQNLFPHNLRLRNSFTYANTVSQGFWLHAKIVSGRFFSGAQELRESVLLPSLPCHGLHLSVVGGEERWRTKIVTTPHLEMQKNFIHDLELLKESLKLNLYPSTVGIKLWSGGILKYERSQETKELLGIIYRLFPELINKDQSRHSYIKK